MEPQWNRSETAMNPLWNRSETAMGPRWNRGGTGVGAALILFAQVKLRQIWHGGGGGGRLPLKSDRDKKESSQLCKRAVC